MNTILFNANVYTVNRKQPRATALAIANDKIIAVGKDVDIKSVKLPASKLIDMKGAFIMPGLIDAHVHLQMSGFWLRMVDLFEVPSVAEAIKRVKARAAKTPKGDWLRGRGWLQAVWTPDRLPIAHDMDLATTEHPVVLTHKSGHALWVNSATLQKCGINRDTPNPEGGQIDHDENGNPNGILHEAAMALVYGRIPPASQTHEEQVTIDIMHAMNKVGLTSVHCMDGAGGIGTFNTYQRVLDAKKATLRVVKNLPAQDLSAILGAGLRSGFGGPMLKIGGVKFFKDGALGPRSALMLEEYSDDPGNHGISTYEQEQLAEDFIRCHSAGLSTLTHAIGDKANRDVLDAIEFSRHNNSKETNALLRDRIEHSQHIHPADLDRWAALNVIASVQPIHATQDFPMAFPRLGQERCATTYAFATLKKSGARLAFGTDSPVESFDPFACMYAAVTRRRLDGTPGPKGFFPAERIGIKDTIYYYTLGAAYAGYQETEVGSIEPGKFADIVVLDRDLSAVKPAEILDIKVIRTMVNGNWVI